MGARVGRHRVAALVIGVVLVAHLWMLAACRSPSAVAPSWGGPVVAMVGPAAGGTGMAPATVRAPHHAGCVGLEAAGVVDVVPAAAGVPARPPDPGPGPAAVTGAAPLLPQRSPVAEHVVCTT